MKRDAIDFHAVEEHQRPMDIRLANWAAWCNSGWGAPKTSAMFRMVPPPPRVRGDIASYGSVPVDTADAAIVSKGVQALPAPHRAALNWHYIKPTSPRRACQEIGTTMDGLAQYVRDARQMLINRKV